MSENPKAIRVDIVSDVVCPWCAVGYKQLARAAEQVGVELDVHWHPFELNSQMPDEGQDLREHLAMKYGTTPADSKAFRERLTALGEELGFAFNYADGSRIWNTFRAHQLIDWAADQGKEHDAKLALLKAYFTDREDVSDMDVLVRVANDLGLDGEAAHAMLASGERAQKVREHQKFWTDRYIQGVPAMVVEGERLVTGAQGVERYASLLQSASAKQQDL